jgi:hypothetical protein
MPQSHPRPQKIAGSVRSLASVYERERRPISEQVSRFAMNTAPARALQRGALPETIEQSGPTGDAARARIGREAYEINVGQFCCGGLNFGYFYAGSPIIAYDGDVPPAYTIDQFRQSTVPGCRTPHLWLHDGRSLYDLLGSDVALLRFDPTVEVGDLVRAAAHRGVPMAVVDIDGDEAELYSCKLLLSRPDQHVAWRAMGCRTIRWRCDRCSRCAHAGVGVRGPFRRPICGASPSYFARKWTKFSPLSSPRTSAHLRFRSAPPHVGFVLDRAAAAASKSGAPRNGLE